MQIIFLPTEATITYRALWNGISTLLDSNGSLAIKHGLISQSDTASKKDMPIFDFSDYTILPAFIDSHVHLTMPYNVHVQLEERAQQYLAAGVYAIRDAGSKDGFFQQSAPLLCLQPGTALYQEGSYGSSLGCSVRSMQEALHVIDKLAENGASHIKVITSGIFSFTQFGQTGPATFTADELKQIVNRAKTHGLPVMAHASGNEAIKRCLQAKVTTIEHGYFMTAETLSELAATETFWVPTLSPVEAQLSVAQLSEGLSPKVYNVITRSLKQHEELVAQAGVLGVRVVAGTDAGAPGVEHGLGLIREILLLCKAGLSTAAALMAATSTAAKACNLSSSGTIEVKKRPYLLAVAGNPFSDPSVLQKPVALFLPASSRQ